MRLILLGPPGAGKGTQAKLLTKRFNIPHISTGDILRDELNANTSLGRRVASFVKTGELVPDDIVIEVVSARLKQPDAQGGFILDGFPRTLKQANKLTAALRQANLSLDLIIYFKTTPEVCIRRLSGRRVCKDCGANFHIINMQPKKDGICDFCAGELILREDDKEQTVKKRLSIYGQQTSGLIDYYKKTGKLRTVSGDLKAEELNLQLMDLFAQEQLISK